MNSLIKKCRYSLKLPVLAFLVFITFEWMEYSVTPFLHWSKKSFSHDSIKMLIVGDPQLIGYRYAPSGLLGFIFRFDADRYLRKTFSLAHNYIQPDLVIFLGDNFDEGEIASDEEFAVYFDRFRQVFQEVNFRKAIIVPGDNDIGGEHSPPDPVYEKRFNHYFKNDVFIEYKFLEFVKANFITHSSQYQLAPNISKTAIRILISHIPLTPTYSTFVSRMIPFVQPHIILSSHNHMSEYLIAERKTGKILRRPSTPHFNSYSFNTTESILHEIISPTCSYRMGTEKMGYGILEIKRTGEASYTVLWLPSRFRQLLVHLVVSIVLIVYFTIHICRYYLPQRNNFNSRTTVQQNRLHV